MHETNPLITVVIPVYNVEAYLEKCLNSVLAQSYPNLEIILVDDGATDRSGQICDRYQEMDARIKVIHKSNGGLSDARNKGIELASGEYITFIDSDDYVTADYVRYLYSLVQTYGTLLSVCPPYIVHENGKMNDMGQGYTEVCMDTQDALARMLNEQGYSVSAWAKLYHRTLFADVRYPVRKLCEDNGTTYKLIRQCSRIAYGEKPQYYYLKREGSIMSQKFHAGKLDMLTLTDAMCDELEQQYPRLQSACSRRRIYARFNVLRQWVFSDYQNEPVEKELLTYLRTRWAQVLFGKAYSMRDKAAMAALLAGKGAFRFLWGVYAKLREA